jgi:hypothetical protein
MTPHNNNFHLPLARSCAKHRTFIMSSNVLKNPMHTIIYPYIASYASEVSL